MRASWVPLGLGAVAFVCGLVLLIDALSRRQERTGRTSLLLGAGAVPAGLPVVLAGTGAAVVIAVGTVSTLVAALATGTLSLVTIVVVTARRRLR